MQGIRSWVSSLIAAAILTGVVAFLTPKGNFEKPMKVLLSLVMLVSFLSAPVGLVANSQELEDGLMALLDEYDAQEATEETVKKTLASEIVSSILAYAQSVGISVQSVRPSISIDEDNNIAIKRIEIVLYGAAENREKIDDYVYRSFSVHPTVKEVKDAETVESEDG
ncbi:MAG TPA: hypothetical protein DDY98_07940 [Ruminococcaceae bacterium]|nr:hypothetical protein [Oscillospiraceae bacterium]